MAWIITKDDRPQYGRYATEAEAFGELLRKQPHSTAHAMEHEGWGIEQVPDNRWGQKEADQLRATARRLLADHSHPWTFQDREDEAMCKENCGACVLNGYWVGANRNGEYLQAKDLERAKREFTDGPNYAGWSRILVQAGRPIPALWKLAWYRDGLMSDNEAYAKALLMDVATFDVKFLEGSMW